MNKLKICHFNCNSIANKKEEFELFLDKHSPDLVSLNEIKLSIEKANYLLRFNNYVSYHKCRKKNGNKGGGVAILAKNTIKATRLI